MKEYLQYFAFLFPWRERSPISACYVENALSRMRATDTESWIVSQYTGGMEIIRRVLSSLGWVLQSKPIDELLVRWAGKDREALKQCCLRFMASYVASLAWGQAWIYGTLGDKEHTLRHLEEAYEQHACTLLFIACAPEFECLRGDPGSTIYRIEPDCQDPAHIN